ncbi:MAG: 2-amino-4-hydroxy-6-hydroxymethyldihydropteridine diphosphokinase [Thermoleophilaceae bacterium]|jgi:2-amino-4-hydroxy-6-hydroxymethyldihydropteridine diphosphokinase|nr:2-amino-4-hydroxy-6-hydroxymethyldihydropteridine diphosphokinase [Thermoleophilaceae bacterium]
MIGFIGLGSNVGDRTANLLAACDRLEDHGVAVLARSSIYETAPQGEMLDQPDFLNAVVEVETDLAPEELLAACKEIEGQVGREPGGPRHGPRIVDLDVLLLGELEVRSERMTLPHPEILSRRFVLEPLLELRPGLELPGGRIAADAMRAVLDQPVRPVSPL